MHRSVKAERSLPIRRERGVALIMVLGLLALLGSVIADFQYASHVDLQLAFNARDELQAEYNAMSALRFRALILRQSSKIRDMMNVISASFGMGGGTLPIGQILEMLPVECGLMSAITKLSGKTLDEDDRRDKKTGKHDGDDEKEEFFPGECMATSTSEHSKISINLLRQVVEGRAQQVASQLLGMLSDPRMLRHFQEDDRNGQHAESPIVLINAITDWIDADHVEAGGLVGDEDRRYEFLKDHYRTKNAPFDSLAELQLVYGIDDEMYNLLKDNVTIYNTSATIELATAPLERILYWGLPALVVPGASMEQLGAVLPAVAQALQLARAGGFGLLNTQALSAILKATGPQIFDISKVNQVFSDSSSTTWYTIDAEGRLGNASRHIRAVFQAAEGQFYYARVD